MNTSSLLVATLQLRPMDGSVPLRSWTAVAPESVTALIDYEQGAQWLLRRLHTTGAESYVPPPLLEALRRRARDQMAKCMLVDEEATDIVRWLSSLGIPHILLKGCARRAAAGRYPCADARLTRDVDVLVPGAELDRAWNSLCARGYTRVSDTVSPGHAPGLIGPRRVGVELHYAMAHGLPADEAWARAASGAATMTWHGERVVVPAATELLWHGLTHALRHDTEAFTLRHFLDAASILAGTDIPDWGLVRARLDGGEAGDAHHARAWLGGAAALAGSVVPSVAMDGVPPFPVERALAWRLLVFERAAWSVRAVEGLIEEGTRAQLGLPRRGVVEGTSALIRLRRRAAALAARAAFRTWDAAH